MKIMEKPAVLRDIRNLVRATQAQMGEVLLVTQSTIAQRERKGQNIAESDLQRIIDKWPGQASSIREVYRNNQQAEITLRRVVGALRQTVGERANAPSVEEDALPWVHTGRSACLVAEVARRSRLAGLSVRMPAFDYDGERLKLEHGVVIRDSPRSRGDRPVDALMHGSVRPGFDVAARTLLVFGSKYMHPATDLFLSGPLGWSIQMTEPSRFFYFGYDTRATYLTVDKKDYHPQRFVGRSGVEYEDFGVIDWRNLDEGNLFDADKRIIVAGCHRLATVVGARLVMDTGLRHKILGGDEKFHATGSIIFRVRLEGISRLVDGRSNVEDREEFEIIETRLT